jgi:hypothetical protein
MTARKVQDLVRAQAERPALPDFVLEFQWWRRGDSNARPGDYETFLSDFEEVRNRSKDFDSEEETPSRLMVQEGKGYAKARLDGRMLSLIDCCPEWATP